jgi:hypothetical protein
MSRTAATARRKRRTVDHGGRFAQPHHTCSDGTGVTLKEQGQMSHDQSHLDDGAAIGVVAILLDDEGNLVQVVPIGLAKSYAIARSLVRACGFRIAPEGEGSDIGHLPKTEGRDSDRIPILT